MENNAQQPPQQTPAPAQVPPQGQSAQTPPTQPPAPPSSASPKKFPIVPVTAIFIISIIVIMLIIIFFMKEPSKPAVNQILVPTGITKNMPPTSIPTPIQSNTDSLPAGNSDTQLQQDVQNIDSTISTASSDLDSVDQGLNDQPVNLTE